MSLELDHLASLENQTSAIQLINENFDRVETAFEDVVTTTEGGAMLVPLDMNSKRIINLGTPATGTDAVRLLDIQGLGTLSELVVPGLAGNAGRRLTTDGVSLVWEDPVEGLLEADLNLSDLEDAAEARDNLGLGTAAEKDVGFSGDTVPTCDEDITWAGTHTFQDTVQLTGGTVFGGAGSHVLDAAVSSLSENSIGFRGIPTANMDTNYSFQLSDAGRCRLHTSASSHSYTISPDSTTNFPNGTVIVIDNIGAGTVVVTRGSGVVLRKEGSATDANVTVNQWGVAVLRKRSANNWVLAGSNIT